MMFVISIKYYFNIDTKNYAVLEASQSVSQCQTVSASGIGSISTRRDEIFNIFISYLVFSILETLRVEWWKSTLRFILLPE